MLRTVTNIYTVVYISGAILYISHVRELEIQKAMITPYIMVMPNTIKYTLSLIV